MSEAQTLEINSASHLRNAARIAKDEAELEALKKQARGEVDEPEEETAKQEEPDSSQPVESFVAAEGDSQQKEKPEAVPQMKMIYEDELNRALIEDGSSTSTHITPKAYYPNV